MYYVFERGMDRGAGGGGVGEIAREMREVQGERDEYDVTARDALECVYEAQGDFFVWCLCWYVWV